jgi:hypothetical protein
LVLPLAQYLLQPTKYAVPVTTNAPAECVVGG